MRSRKPGYFLPASRAALAALLLLAAGAAAAFTAPASITVVTDDAYPPYLFRGDDGRLQGITKDKWDLWAARTGVAVRVEGMDWIVAQQQVQAGAADVLEAVALTPKRVQLYEFSRPYATIDSRVFFHRSLSVSANPASMSGFAVGAKDGSACG